MSKGNGSNGHGKPPGFKEAKEKVYEVLRNSPKESKIPPRHEVFSCDDINELVKEDIDLGPELIAGMLYKGAKMMIAGSAKTFKSWFALGLATVLSSGDNTKKWLNKYKVTPCNVLYLNLEIRRNAFGIRCKRVYKAIGLTQVKQRFVTLNLRGKDLSSGDNWRRFVDYVEGLGEWDVVIVDPIYKISGDRDEVTAVGVGLICRDLDLLAEQTGAAIIYVHHYAKGDASLKSFMDRSSGSGVWGRDVDVSMGLTRHKENGCYTVECEVRDFSPIDKFVVEWDRDMLTHVVRNDLDPEELWNAVSARTNGKAVKVTLADKVEDLLRDGVKRTVSQIIEQTGLLKLAVIRSLSKLKEDKIVKQQGRLYFIKPKL